MISLENTEVFGWEAAIRGMRNPMNSWENCDSNWCCDKTKKDNVCPERTFKIGSNDIALMIKLAEAGSVHAKYRRFITVTVDIIAPLYWWKEFDTYKVGTVANSCSTMHKIAAKEFTFDDFSHEHLNNYIGFMNGTKYNRTLFEDSLASTINYLNMARKLFLQTSDKQYWWQIIQLLPSSYNQRRTVMLNYEVLAGLYPMRKHHRLDEWCKFCKWIEDLPYSEVITT